MNEYAIHTSHPIKRILSSRQPAMVSLKYVLLLMAVVMGALNLKFIAQSLLRPAVYQKDFIQEYLLGRAILEGVDPYLPLPELASRFLGPLPYPVLQHPTPHPPPVALPSLPLGLLSYEGAAVVWFGLEMLCVGVAVYMLLRWLGRRPGVPQTAFFTLLAIGWTPLRDEIAIGQLMTALLVLLVGAWLALRSGREVLGGFLLGCMIALKLMAWPVVIYLALRRNWRAVITAGVTAAAANLGAAALMGLERVLYYYLEVSGIVSPLYHAHEANLSLWTIGWRVFEGTGSPVLVGFEAPPLIAAPGLAPYVSLALPLVLLGIGLALALRASFDTAFSILVCVSLLVNPVSWNHYLILALIPLLVAGRRLWARDWPQKETWALLGVGLLLFIPRLGLRRFVVQLAGYEPYTTSTQVSFPLTLLILIPLAGVLGLLWLMWHTERALYPAK